MMRYLHIVLFLTLSLSNSPISAIFSMIGALVRTMRTGSVMQARTFACDSEFDKCIQQSSARLIRIKNNSGGYWRRNQLEEDRDAFSDKLHVAEMQLGSNYPKFLASLLEISAGLDTPKESRTILKKASGLDIDVTGSAALHLAQSEETAQLLLQANFDVNFHSDDIRITPLHMVPDVLIPFLLKHGADPCIEDQGNIPSGAGWFGTFTRIGMVNSGWKQRTSPTPGELLHADLALRKKIPGYQQEEIKIADVGTQSGDLSPLEVYEGLNRFFWTKIKIGNVLNNPEQGTVPENERLCDMLIRKPYTMERHIRMTPPAYALQRGDIARFKLFLSMLSPEIIKPQIPKLKFLAKWLPGYYPDHKERYRIFVHMLDAYEAYAQHVDPAYKASSSDECDECKLDISVEHQETKI